MVNFGVLRNLNSWDGRNDPDIFLKFNKLTFRFRNSKKNKHRLIWTNVFQIFSWKCDGAKKFQPLETQRARHAINNNRMSCVRGDRSVSEGILKTVSEEVMWPVQKERHVVCPLGWSVSPVLSPVFLRACSCQDDFRCIIWADGDLEIFHVLSMFYQSC